MVKSRMSVVDCTRMAAEVNSLLSGSWVQNIYTTTSDSKTFLFKVTGRGDKYLLLIESGVRFHPTEFVREKSDMPSGFAMKLRKHVKGRRLEYCRQVGLDRVVDFAFGKGTQHHHVVLEMYAGGNVILTDESGIILTLLRPYTLEEGDSIRVAVGERYPFDLALEGPRALLFKEHSITATELEKFVEDFLVTVEEEERKFLEDEDEIVDNEAEEVDAKSKKGPSTVKGGEVNKISQKPKKKKDKKKRPTEMDHRRDLLNCLSSKGSPVQSYGPQLIEHCLTLAKFNPVEKIQDMEFIKKYSSKLADALEEAPKIMNILRDESTSLPGYIEMINDDYYEGFEPYRWTTTNTKIKLKEYPSFYQTRKKTRLAAEKANISRIENVKKQQAERVAQLQTAVVERSNAAMILEKNVDIVDKAINAVNSLLGAAMSWEQIANVIKTEKKNGNPVAAIVSGLKLEENKITVALSENDAEEEEAEEEEEEQQTSKQKFGKKKMLIDVLLNQSAQGNVRLMFQDKKKAAAKATVTVEKSHQAVEDMLLKLQSETKKNKVKQQPAVRSVRKPYWFEKFHWFLTSEGILVLGGRDAHQNELLFKKFLRKGDAYMHADIHGAPTVIVRNPFPKTGTAITIPIESMRQAGLFCICKSPAWVSKIVTSAWWVESYQVSRTAPSGEYLPTGSFMIRGKKNYLQPTKLEMGFGYIFKIDLTAREEQDNKEGEENEKRKDENEKEWRYLRGKVSPPELFQSGNGGVEDAASSSLVTVIDVGVKAKKDSIPSKKNERTTAKNQSSQQQTKSNPFQQQAQEKPKQVASTTQSKKKLLKQKRIAQKYGDQTEEEKRLALIALGHLKLDATEHQKQAENEEEVAGEKGHSDDENDDTGDAVATSWLVKNAIDPSTRAPEPKNMPKNEEDGDDEKESNDGKEVQKEKVQEEDEENEEDQVEEEEVLLKGFTAIPSSDDVILYALPFCGPMDAMAHFKFRVKLTPGTLKKGKAAKQAVSLFQSIASEREKAIIYGISDPENVAVMMMDVKVSAPGIEKIRAQEKNKKKTQKQVSNNNNPPATEEEEL